MRRSVIAGFLVVVSVSGCASMKGTSTSEGSRAAQVPAPAKSAAESLPPPPATPPSKPEPSTNEGADQSSTPAKTPDSAAPQPPPVSPATRSGPAKAKSSSDPRLAKQTGAAAHTGPPVSPAPPSAPAAAPAPIPGPTPAPSASPTLNLADLEQRLRQTSAIGVFTKLSLKNQVDDLLNAFRALYKGPNKHPTVELRQRYDQLLLKVLTLLQDGDPPLAAAISSSREAIWSILADPDKFAKI
jgi:hypothetical protein